MSTDPDRDPALAARWREYSTETPPPHIDAAILAAAHRAAASAPRGRQRWLGPRAWRWWMPLAAAAVIAGVVVGVKPPGQALDDAVQSATDMPAVPAEKQVTAPAPEARQKTPEITAPIATPSRKETARAKGDERAAAMPRAAQGVAPKVEQDRAQRFVAPPASRPETRMAPPKAPGAAAANGASTPSASQAMREDAETQLSAHAQILTIRTLRDHGRDAEAARALTRFRAEFPDADARLPADLREWAKTVR